ncbi:MAG: hypothetical protein EPO07_08435 [Verrucomicrobia bacterium]|nr:MAG: hypothetical protein EPO07_08435 [Verrucomicrobiota bacterium]
MNPRVKKILQLLLAVALLVGAAQVQRGLNVDRERLGLTHVAPLENAPPMLAFTTVALGGFRGLIANALWIRATELQDDDKFFEMRQIADWVTKLEPHYSMVWTHQAWNMAYNISVKFKETEPGEYPDRWRWVKAGIELLRDEGLKYNPNDVLIHQQLSWLYQHKLGANLDDANVYYKKQWANEMAAVFGKTAKPDLNELVNPQTDEARARAKLLRERYKMDAALVKEVDERYGPMEWRLPEAHAVYWAAAGLRKAEENPARVKAEDLMQLRRSIYQSMQLSFHRGRLLGTSTGMFDTGPNLEIIPKVNASYEEQLREALPENHNNIRNAQRNFLRAAVYFLYVNDRIADAAKWYAYLGEKYPDRPVLDADPNSFPATVTLDEYAVRNVVGDITETSRDRVKSAVEGYLVRAYRSLVYGEDSYAEQFVLFARRIRATYQKKIETRAQAIGLPEVAEIQAEVLKRLLDPEEGWPEEVRAALRRKLGMPAESAEPSTNAPPASISTNAPSRGS